MSKVRFSAEMEIPDDAPEEARELAKQAVRLQALHELDWYAIALSELEPVKNIISQEQNWYRARLEELNRASAWECFLNRSAMKAERASLSMTIGTLNILMKQVEMWEASLKHRSRKANEVKVNHVS